MVILSVAAKAAAKAAYANTGFTAEVYDAAVEAATVAYTKAYKAAYAKAAAVAYDYAKSVADAEVAANGDFDDGSFTSEVYAKAFNVALKMAKGDAIAYAVKSASAAVNKAAIAA